MLNSKGVWGFQRNSDSVLQYKYCCTAAQACWASSHWL